MSASNRQNDDQPDPLSLSLSPSPANCPPLKPILAVTLGDAAGVGPELCLRLLLRASSEPLPYLPVVIGNRDLLEGVSVATNLPLHAPVIETSSLEQEGARSPLLQENPAWVVDIPWLREAQVRPGRVQEACGQAAGEFIRYAVEGVQQGWFDGILTAPINKESLHQGGFHFPGHTEMLAHLGGVSGREAMLLFSEKISVSFATLHTSLSDACRDLRSEEIVRVGQLMDRTLRQLKGRKVLLGVLALNPHSGEGGLFGEDEKEKILPAVNTLKEQGILAEGPLVPDAAFTPSSLQRYDGFVCMYHDQGSIPFKMLSFEEGVNLTMGLPFVRTSPDHGTAFDIAWQGIASPSSFFAAADLAGRLMVSHG